MFDAFAIRRHISSPPVLHSCFTITRLFAKGKFNRIDRLHLATSYAAYTFI
jgi:hypothetical protein